MEANLTVRIHVGVVVLGLTTCIAGCGGSDTPSPSSPSPVVPATMQAPAQRMSDPGDQFDEPRTTTRCA
jgi:hypothetical protein